MSAAPLPANESQRLSALLELGLLDTGPEEDYDALAVAVAQACDCPIGSVSLVDATRQWFKAAHGLALSELPRENSFCAHAILGSSLFVIADTLADVRFCDNPFALAPDGIRFYAGMPLQLDGVTLGTLAVMDTRPRELGPTQRQALIGLARVAVELLRSRRRVRALHEERTRLHDLARASGDWMWELDAQLRYRWISGQFEPVTGIPPEALLGREVEDALLLDAGGMPLGSGERLLGLLRQRLPFSRVVTAKHTPRGQLLVSRSALPVVDEAGHFRGWRGTARDVTSRIDAEHNAAQHDERLRKLSSQIPGLIFQYLRHADGRSEFPFVSRGVEAVFGVSAEEVAREPSNAFQIFHPQDRQRVLAGIERSAAELTVWYDEYRVVRRDGQDRWLETRASPERLPDGATLWHAFSADVTDRKQTEAALRLGEARWEMAAQATGMGLAELDLASGRLQFDERACRNHGLPWPSPDFTLGDWVQSMHPDDRERAAAAVHRAVQTRGALNNRARVIHPTAGSACSSSSARPRSTPPARRPASSPPAATSPNRPSTSGCGRTRRARSAPIARRASSYRA
ncbi:MAG: PAS domain-containing protein [Piscinibacter sp.]|nr:PAS domain-containing protein [Piscinibacter sp.]